MKTLAYNTGKQILTSILALVLFTTLSTKAQLPSDQKYPEVTASVADLKNITMDNKITEDTAASNILNELKSWMNNGSYWEPVADVYPAKEKLMQMLSAWMKEGAYWEDNGNDSFTEDYFNEPVAKVEEK